MQASRQFVLPALFVDRVSLWCAKPMGGRAHLECVEPIRNRPLLRRYAFKQPTGLR